MAGAGARAQALRRVIRVLGAADGQELDAAIVQAAQVLEQDNRFRGYDEVLRRPSWRRSMPADYAESYPQRIRGSAFLLLYKTAAEVRIPEPTPDLERRARWERVQERLAEIRRRV